MPQNNYIKLILILFFSIYFWGCGTPEIEPELVHNHGHEHNINKVINEENDDEELITGMFHQARFCPNSNVFVYTTESGNDLFIKYEKEKEGKKILSLKGAGNNIGWSKNCDRIYFKEKNENYKVVIKSININSLAISNHPEFDPGVNLQSLSISDTVYNLDLISHDIYANYKGNDVIINKKKGNYYKFLLGPNNKHFVLHEGAQIQLFSVNGEFIKSLGKGIATQWAADGKSLIGFLDKSENGHSVTSSDLYQFFIDKNEAKQLTFTPNIFEMWPSIGPDKEIIYSDGLNGGIYKSKIQL